MEHNIDAVLIYPVTNENCKHLVISMGSSSDNIENAIQDSPDHGLLKINLLRPIDEQLFVDKIRSLKHLKTITVLDRSRDYTSDNELYTTLNSILAKHDLSKSVRVLCGTYGLSGKDLSTRDIRAIYENAETAQKSNFTVGIIDDIGNTNLTVSRASKVAPPNNKHVLALKFIGLG